MVAWGKGERVIRKRNYLFGATNGERKKMVSLAAGAGLSVPGTYGQRTMTK